MKKKLNIIIATFLILGAFVLIVFTMGVPMLRDEIREGIIIAREEPSTLKVQYLTKNVIRIYPYLLNDVEALSWGYFCNFVVTLEPPFPINKKVGITYFEVILKTSTGSLVERVEYYCEYDSSTGYPTIQIINPPANVPGYVVLRAYPRIKKTSATEHELTLGPYLVGCIRQGEITVKILVKTLVENRERGIFTPESQLGWIHAKIYIPNVISEPPGPIEYNPHGQIVSSESPELSEQQHESGERRESAHSVSIRYVDTDSITGSHSSEDKEDNKK